MVLSLPEREERIKLSVGVSPVLIFCVLLGARILTKDTLTIIQVRYKYDQTSTGMICFKRYFHYVELIIHTFDKHYKQK